LQATLDQSDVSLSPVRPPPLSLTQATEFGALYSSEQIADLTGAARAKGLRVHLDGARMANAVAAGFDPKAIKSAGRRYPGARRDQGRP